MSSVIHFDGLNFETVQSSREHIHVLYELLNERRLNISHKSRVSLAAHRRFIQSNPYRFWFLVKDRTGYLGAVYVTTNNHIGLDLRQYAFKYCRIILKFITQSVPPLPSVPSVRRQGFAVNVNPENRRLKNQLIKFGAKKTQETFELSAGTLL
jgi:hypothetical protein